MRKREFVHRSDSRHQHDHTAPRLVHRHSPQQRRVLEPVLDPGPHQVVVERDLAQLERVVVGPPVERPVGQAGTVVLVDVASGRVGQLDVLEGRLGATSHNGELATSDRDRLEKFISTVENTDFNNEMRPIFTWLGMTSRSPRGLSNILTGFYRSFLDYLKNPTKRVEKYKTCLFSKFSL